jgi:hypothetical protein
MVAFKILRKEEFVWTEDVRSDDNPAMWTAHGRSLKLMHNSRNREAFLLRAPIVTGWVACSGRMTEEGGHGKELAGNVPGLIQFPSRYIVCLEELTKPMNDLSQNNRYPSQSSNRGPSEYESRLILLYQRTGWQHLSGRFISVWFSPWLILHKAMVSVTADLIQAAQFSPATVWLVPSESCNYFLINRFSFVMGFHVSFF